MAKLFHLTNPSLRLSALFVASCAAMALTACSGSSTAQGAEQAAGPKSAQVATAPASSFGGSQRSAAAALENVAGQVSGFVVGNSLSPRTVYIFFDPQCPHCGELWASAKPLASKARFVWVPVSLLRRASGPQGAVLLASKTPAQTMDQHEASLLAKQGGISAMGASDELKASVEKNTEVLKSLDAKAVPFIFALNGKSGQLVAKAAALPTAELQELLGL